MSSKPEYKLCLNISDPREEEITRLIYHEHIQPGLLDCISWRPLTGDKNSPACFEIEESESFNLVDSACKLLSQIDKNTINDIEIFRFEVCYLGRTLVSDVKTNNLGEALQEIMSLVAAMRKFEK